MEELAEVNTDLTTQLTLGHQEEVDTEHQTKVVEVVEQVKVITELVEEAMELFHPAVTVVMAEAVEF